MAKFLKLASWKARELSQHAEELKPFISIHNIVMLISEMHFTEKSYLKIPNCMAHHTNHRTGRGGTAVIIRNCIKKHQLNSYSRDSIQATSVSVEVSVGLLTILAVYLPPRHTVKQEQFEDYYNTLLRRFIACGHYNAKHTDYINTLKHLSTREPT
jgi:hypothetical protein